MRHDLTILGCGDREWTQYEPVQKELLNYLGKNVLVVHGDARGADTIVGEVASQLDFDVLAIPADWQTYGRSAGPIRNQVMLDQQPDIVLAFHDDIENSKGTKDMVKRAKAVGVECKVITSRK
jgi:hypothetical protein